MLTDYFYKTLAAERKPVLVVEVGFGSASLGAGWNVFGRALHGVGFNPVESEVERFNAMETQPSVRYEAALVGLTQEQKREASATATLSPRQRFNPVPIKRSSAARASRPADANSFNEASSADANPSRTRRETSIDEWSAETGQLPQILKVNVHGSELEVLRGASKTIETSLLALQVECFFQGPSDFSANGFSEIESFLRKMGFSLFTMEPFRYSRSALPAPFLYDLAAQTTTGQMMWANALFLRDLAADDYETTFGFEATPERIIVTACVMERFGLQDCAAELLTHFAGRFTGGVERALDALVPDHLGSGLSYQQYVSRFEENPKVLFPTALRPKAEAQMPVEPVDAAKPPDAAPLLIAKASDSIAPRDGLIDPAWGATVRQGSFQRVDLQTPARLWAYTYIVRMPEGEGPGLVEIDIRVTKGRIGVAVLGETIADLNSVVWLDADEATKVLVLPVADIGKSKGIVIRNGTEDASASSASIEKARLLKP